MQRKEKNKSVFDIVACHLSKTTINQFNRKYINRLDKEQLSELFSLYHNDPHTWSPDKLAKRYAQDPDVSVSFVLNVFLLIFITETREYS